MLDIFFFFLFLQPQLVAVETGAARIPRRRRCEISSDIKDNRKGNSRGIGTEARDNFTRGSKITDDRLFARPLARARIPPEIRQFRK